MLLKLHKNVLHQRLFIVHNTEVFIVVPVSVSMLLQNWISGNRKKDYLDFCVVSTCLKS